MPKSIIIVYRELLGVYVYIILNSYLSSTNLRLAKKARVKQKSANVTHVQISYG